MTPVANATIPREQTLESSVGSGGTNRRRDVRIIQDLLNKAARAGLAVDGAFGPRTLSALTDFQQGSRRPQRLVEPQDSLHTRLVDEAREKAGPPKHTPQEASSPSDGLRLVPLPRNTSGMYSYSGPEFQWGTAKTIDTIVAVARVLAAHPLGLEVGVGHVSFEQGGNMPPHKTHRNGRNIDLRPISSDGGRRPLTISDSLYSSDRTRVLVEALQKQGTITRILFNDQAIDGVRFFAGHHNHLHVEVAG